MLLATRGALDVVTRAWEGRTVVCIATGPSLTQAQIETVRAAREADVVRVIAISDAYLVAPFADLLFFADQKWHDWHVAGLARDWGWCRFSAEQARQAFAGFAGQKCSVLNRKPGCFVLRSAGLAEMSLEPTTISTGHNGGFMALNIAALSGGRPILLVGYDGRRGPRGEHHAFGMHPDKKEPPYELMREVFRKAADKLAQLGIEVVNCTPGSAWTCFPGGTLEERIASLLPHPRAAALSA